MCAIVDREDDKYKLNGRSGVMPHVSTGHGQGGAGSTSLEAIRYKLSAQRLRLGINEVGVMQEYAAYYGTACIIFSTYLLIKGFIAASRQRSEDQSTTLVPAYVYGILASILLTVGLGFFRPSLPWWGYRMIFPGTTMLFPAIIYLIGRRPPKPSLDRADA